MIEREKNGRKVRLFFSLKRNEKVERMVIDMPEHAAVNRRVVGSSPTWGASEKPANTAFTGFFHRNFSEKNAQTTGNPLRPVKSKILSGLFLLPNINDIFQSRRFFFK